MHDRPLVSLLLLLMLGTAAGSAAAALYRWEDAEGKVHFSDREPPAGARNARSVDSAPAAEPAADPEQREARERGRKLVEVLQEERRAGEIAQQKADVEAQQRAERCEHIRAERAAASHARYLYRDGEQGAREVLSRAERAAYEEELAQLEDDYCAE